MKTCTKRPREEAAAAVVAEDGGGAPAAFPLPDAIVLCEIFTRLELESLCTVACVCRSLRSLVYQSISTLPSIDLSKFSPHGELVRWIAPRLGAVKKVTIDCLRLDINSIVSILGRHLEELNLLKCPSQLYNLLPSIGKTCPNLRILVLKLAVKNTSTIFRKNLVKMLQNLLHLKYLSIKVRGTEFDAYDLACDDLFIPKTLEFLKLQSVNEQNAVQLLLKLKDDRESSREMKNSCTSSTMYPEFSCFTLTRLSLVVDFISDRLMSSITATLPLLVELDLEDSRWSEPKDMHDLTNNGLLFLRTCQHLTHLSIVRSGLRYPTTFTQVNNAGVLVLAESCRGLESIKLDGFSEVTDDGFSSLVHSCSNLKKLEIHNAPLLSDLAFLKMIGDVPPLVELKLVSCTLIASGAVAEVASSNTLEVLDTYYCSSMADPCLDYISRLSNLYSLNLGGTDITDSGLAVLSKADLPLANLSLRGCKRVTEKGIIQLLNDGIRIKKKLSSLDISYIPGVSDRAIRAVITCTEALTQLCMRNCFYVTYLSFQMLVSGKYGGSNLLRKLDISYCFGLANRSIELQEDLFRGLRWLGVAGSYLDKIVDFNEICRMRPWLTVCFKGCEVGCDGWDLHSTPR